MVKERTESMVLPFYLRLFQTLRKCSLTWIIKKRYYEPRGKDDRKFVEAYVIFNGMFSFSLALFGPQIPQLLRVILVFWGVYRIFQILTVQVNALFFDWYRDSKKRLALTPKIKKGNPPPEPYVIRGYLRITLLLLQNFVEVVFWFSFFYLCSNFAFESGGNPTVFINFLTFSLYSMTTFGHFPESITLTEYGYALTTVQAAIGLFMTLLILARFISLLPRPPTSDPVEQKILEENSRSK